MYARMFFRNGFTIKIYGFMHSSRTFWHVQLRCHRAMEIGSTIQKIEDDARTSPGVWKTVNCSTERQDNGDKKRLALHHLSDLLRSLTRERIGGGQHGVVSPALRASPFRSFHVLHVRHLMRMRIPSIFVAYDEKMAEIRCLF